MKHDAGSDWEERIARLWEEATAFPDDEIVQRFEALANERSPDDPAALFELASAYDSAGREADAEPLYRRALEAGLDENRQPRAIIQFASTLRNLGKLDESVQLLANDVKTGTNPVTGDVASAFLALTLIDLHREREAALVLLRALIPHLPRYHRSLKAYVAAIEDGGRTDSSGAGY